MSGTPVALTTNGSSGTVQPGNTLDLVRPVGRLFSCPPTANVADEVEMGLWDHAWDASGQFQRGPVEEHDFIGADSKRFYVRLEAPALTSNTVRVSLRTRFANAAGEAGNPHHDGEITLTRLSPTSHTYVSRALMIVASRRHAEQSCHSGQSQRRDDLRDNGQPDHRLRLGSMYGFIEAQYLGLTTTRPIFRERHLLGIRAFIVSVDHQTLASGTGAPTIAAAAQSIVAADLTIAREFFARHGIWLWVMEPPASPSARRVPGASEPLAMLEPPAALVQAGALTMHAYTPGRGPNDFNTLGMHILPGDVDLRIFYVQDLPAVVGAGQSHLGLALTPNAWQYVSVMSATDPLESRACRSCFMSYSRSRALRHTLAHEMMHVLLDTNVMQNGGHRDTFRNILRSGSHWDRSGNGDPDSPPEFAVDEGFAEADQITALKRSTMVHLSPSQRPSP